MVGLVVDKVITYLGLLLSRPRVVFYYFYFIGQMKLDLDCLLGKQNERLGRYLVDVPFLNYVRGGDVRQYISDVEVVDKRKMKEFPGRYHNSGIAKRKWKNVQTGGSTGVPFKYRLEKKCEDVGMALLFRGWSYGGYSLGDRVAVLAGGSLVGKKVGFKGRLTQRILNMKKFSSYGVSDEDLFGYYQSMKGWQAEFLRGYVSSVYEFAKYINRNSLSLRFKAVFTTAEMLGEKERKYIESTFSCKVFNNYGLNDGGISAYECEHGSLHVDLERALLEVVDDDGCPIVGEVGRIVATAYNNRATYFVRYDTGDLGVLSSKKCSCGRPYPILDGLKGRSTDAIFINGKMIGSPVLTVLMSHTSVKRYQFHCYSEQVILIVEADKYAFESEDLPLIKKSLFSHVGSFDLRVSYDLSGLEKTSSGKHKVVVNHV